MSITSKNSAPSAGSGKDGTELSTRNIDQTEKKPGTPRAAEGSDSSISAKAAKHDQNLIGGQAGPGFPRAQESKSKSSLSNTADPFDPNGIAKAESNSTEDNNVIAKHGKSSSGINFLPPPKDKDIIAAKKRVGTIGKLHPRPFEKDGSNGSANSPETPKASKYVEPFDASIFDKPEPETSQTKSAVGGSHPSLRSELSELFLVDPAMAERIASQSLSSPTGKLMMALLKDKQKKGEEKSTEGSVKSGSHGSSGNIAEQKQAKIEEKPLQAGIFQRQFYFGISHPGTDLGPGPWSDTLASSPVLQRKLEMSAPAGTYRVQVTTIGKPTGGKEDTRRIKIYEHDTVRNEWDLPLISKQMNATPEKALIAVDEILRNPKTSKKMVDKVLTKSNAIKAITGAQQTLLHIFGSWLNPQLIPSSETGVIEAATEVIYLVDFCPVHGTIARPLKNLPKGANREQVKAAIANLIPVAIDSAWDHHVDTGFSLAVVVPLGRSDMSYYC